MTKGYIAGGALFFLLGATSTSFAISWQPLVNNADLVPGPIGTTFQRYSAPSVNGINTAIFRAEGADGSVGIYSRNMDVATGTRGGLTAIAQSGGTVPQPNDLGEFFDNFTDFPRIAKSSRAVAMVGLHGPVWGGGAPRLGKTGVYVTELKAPPVTLTTAVGQLGSLPEFSAWQVPTSPPGTTFDTFSHASPLVINGVLHVVFRGAYRDGGPQHGIFYRAMDPAGNSPVVALRNTKTSLIPDLTGVPLGYLSPPSAGGNDTAALTALDQPIDWTSTQNPAWGTVGKLHLSKNSYFFNYVKLGYRVPGVKDNARYTRFGDTVSYNGRFIAFWGSWGTEFKPVKMVCPRIGDRKTRRLCRQRHPANLNTPVMQVPVNQAIVVFDNRPKTSRLIDRTSGPGDDYVFWKYSARTDSWHPSIQLALDSEANELTNPETWVAFKMRQGTLGSDGLWSTVNDHLYLSVGLGAKTDLLATGITDGAVLDPNAAGMTVVDLELERDGLRNDILGVHARMKHRRGPETWAGIYLGKLK